MSCNFIIQTSTVSKMITKAVLIIYIKCLQTHEYHICINKTIVKWPSLKVTPKCANAAMATHTAKCMKIL